jgi:anti-sigma factor RsiW
MSHLVPEELEHYVIGALDQAGAARVEAHTASCATCAAALQSEARLEVGLLQLAAQPAPLQAFRRRARVAVAVSALAAAAGLALVFSSVLRVDGRPQPPPRVERCDQSSAPTDCLARAQFDGVLTIGPNQEVVVPRYEQTGSP